MLNFIFENPAQTVEYAQNFLAIMGTAFAVVTITWVVNGIRKTEVK